MSTHHTLDIHPIPEKVLCINEPKFSDQAALNYEHIHKLEEQPEGNICIYVLLDLTCDTIFCGLQDICDRYGYLT